MDRDRLRQRRPAVAPAPTQRREREQPSARLSHRVREAAGEGSRTTSRRARRVSPLARSLTFACNLPGSRPPPGISEQSLTRGSRRKEMPGEGSEPSISACPRFEVDGPHGTGSDAAQSLENPMSAALCPAKPPGLSVHPVLNEWSSLTFPYPAAIPATACESHTREASPRRVRRPARGSHTRRP